MFSLYFTTPAKRDKARAKLPRVLAPSRTQTLFTWVLLLTWMVLMSFGVVSMANPKWLQELSRPGIEAESRNYKDYGDAALRHRDYELAVPQYERSLEIRPGQPGVMVNLAVAYINAGNRPRGAQLLNTAQQMDISHNLQALIHYNLADLAEREGRRDEAVRQYRQALGPYIEEDRVYRKLGSLYLPAGRLELAREAFERTLEAQLDLTLTYRSMLNRGVEKYQDDEETVRIIEEQLARGLTVEDLAPYDVQLIRRLHQTDPEIAKTHNHLGFILARQGDIPAAIQHFERSLQIWPGNIDAERNLQQLRRAQQNRP